MWSGEASPVDFYWGRFLCWQETAPGGTTVSWEIAIGVDRLQDGHTLFHFIASRYFCFWGSETHYGPCNFLKVQNQMKTQIPFQSHNRLLVETIQLATFLTCISDSTTFSKTQTEPSNGDFTDLSQSQQTLTLHEPIFYLAEFSHTEQDQCPLGPEKPS